MCLQYAGNRAIEKKLFKEHFDISNFLLKIEHCQQSIKSTKKNIQKLGITLKIFR